MTDDWQSWAAFAVVVATAVLYLRYVMRRKKNSGCDGDCSCDSKENEPPG